MNDAIDKAEPLYPIGPGSRRSGYSEQWLRELCERGDVEHLRDAGGRRLIPHAEIERLRQRREKAAKNQGTTRKG
jgi:hypothetical protein